MLVGVSLIKSDATSKNVREAHSIIKRLAAWKG